LGLAPRSLFTLFLSSQIFSVFSFLKADYLPLLAAKAAMAPNAATEAMIALIGPKESPKAPGLEKFQGIFSGFQPAPLATITATQMTARPTMTTCQRRLSDCIQDHFQSRWLKMMIFEFASVIEPTYENILSAVDRSNARYG
jgi:hypothetical protein